MATTPFNAINLGDLAPAGVGGERVALIALDDAQKETRYTYAELDAAACAAARGLRARGLQPGQRVAVLSANCADYLVLLLGALRAGITVVPVNYKFPQAMSDFVIRDSDAVMVFSDAERRGNAPSDLPLVVFGDGSEGGFDALLDPGPFDTVQPVAEDLALILYTSGSTGKPKGVKLTHQSHLWVVKTRLGDQDLSDQRYLIAAPMYHMNALALIQLALAGASTIILLPQFTAKAYIEATSRYRATWLTSVPPMMAMLLREKQALETADFSSVQVVRMGSAPVSEALLKAIKHLMPHAKIINSYGTTEGGPVTFGPHPDGLPQPDMSIGYAHPQVRVRLVDEQGVASDQGVLELSSPGIMAGYHKRPDITNAITPDGYYVTGDVLRRDAAGFYYFVGRNDDMFVCGGENIFPGEVEKVLETHPGIQQASVIAVPDEIKGHKPVAFVVLAPGSELDETAIKAHALANAPAYQHPRRVWILPALPLASTNKVDRAELKRRAQAALSETAAVPAKAAAAAMLAVDKLSVVYRTRRGTIEALRDVDLRIGEGEFVTILGPSGCGKSTLLKIAAGLLTPSGGDVAVAGKPVTGPSVDIGIAFQKPTLLPWRTVLDNVLLPAHTLGWDMGPARVRAHALLELMGLKDFADNYPNELSGGMQQRVGLARMLLRDPKLLLMDEPFAALDAMTRESLSLELQRIWMQDQKSVLFITHSIPEAVFLSDRVLVMSARPGRIVEDFVVPLDRPRSLDTMSSPAFVAACRHLRQHFVG